MTPNLENKNGSELSFADLLGIAIGGWKILVATTLLGSAVGFLVAKWMLPVYQADALIQVDTDSKTPGGSLGQLQDLFGSSSKAETEIEIVKSRMVMAPVVDTLKLRYRATPIGALRRLRGKQGRVALGMLSLPWQDEKSPPWMLEGRDSGSMVLLAPEGDSVATAHIGQPLQAIFEGDTILVTIDSARFSENERFVLSVASDMEIMDGLSKQFSVAEKGKKTGILGLSYQGQYPDRAAAVLNEIAKSYLRQNIDAKSAEAQKTLNFMKAQLPSVKGKMDSADSALNAYRQAKGTVDLTAEAQMALSQQVQLEQQRLELEQRKQELVRLYKEDHPQVLSLNAQIDRIRRILGKSSSDVKGLPATQQEVLKLMRDVQVATTFYQAMLGKIQELEVVKAGEVGSVRIIDFARQPRKPVKPNRKLIFLMGILGGFTLGMGGLLFRRTIDVGVRDVAQLEKLTQASVFAQIPLCTPEELAAKKGGARGLLVNLLPDDLTVESLRNLRTALDFSLLGQGGNVLAITGMTPGVGKSFISANLAALFAMAGKRVILIDADLRKGRLHNHFGGNRAPGLSDVLAGRSSLADVTRTDDKTPNLYFIATGKVPPNPSEMLGSHQLADAVQALRASYDLVLIDTPPILLVTDPALVMRHVDHATLVVEYGAHGPSDIQEAMKLLRVRPDLPLSLALNKCRDEFGAYGSYGRYGKYGRYGRYGKYSKYGDAKDKLATA